MEPGSKKNLKADIIMIAFLACLVSFTGGAGGAQLSKPIITPDELKPGMKGYGLSVFKGEEPQRFEVEVVDVMKNALLDQDMILVMCSGQDLEKTRVIAGMSGSPVFIEGRLAGAVAYAWAFAHDPLAGVTPITNMIHSLEKTPATPPARAHAGPAKGILFGDDKDKSGEVQARAKGPATREGLAPIATPLLASGFSPEGIDTLTEELSEYNMVPMQGGGLSYARLDRAAAEDLKPGSAIGAVLMSGDLCLTAIGTLTWKEGDKVLAFGHPFLSGGPVSMPLVSARIHTVISSQRVSVKMGSPKAMVGALVMDEQAAIVGELGKQADMIPVKVKVQRQAFNFENDFEFRLAGEHSLAPRLIVIALSESIRKVAPSREPLTVKVSSRLWLDDYGQVEYEDVYPVLRGNFQIGFMDPVLFFFTNPFERVELDKIEMDLSVTDQLKVATVDSVWTDTDEVSPGSTVEVGVLLRPYDEKGLVEYKFQVMVPLDRSLKVLNVTVGGGNQVRPDQAVPRDVPDMIRYMDAVYPADNLVLTYRVPRKGIDVKGVRMRDLPSSIDSVLQPGNATEPSPAPARMDMSKKTPYVILGAKRLVLKVGDKRKPKK